jgi:hypothetical protein
MFENIYPHRVTYYLPSTDRHGVTIDLTTRCNNERAIITKILEHATGATKSHGYGYWKNSVGEVIEERVTLVTVFYATIPEYESVAALAQDILTTYDQDAVAVEAGGVLHVFNRPGSQNDEPTPPAATA